MYFLFSIINLPLRILSVICLLLFTNFILRCMLQVYRRYHAQRWAIPRKKQRLLINHLTFFQLIVYAEADSICHLFYVERTDLSFSFLILSYSLRIYNIKAIYHQPSPPSDNDPFRNHRGRSLPANRGNMFSTGRAILAEPMSNDLRMVSSVWPQD